MVASMAGMVFILTQLFSDKGASSTHNDVHREEHAAQNENPFAAMADAFSGEIDYAPDYSALDPLTPAVGSAARDLFNPQDDYWGLPRTTGYEETAAYCTACHSLRIVMQQRQTREGWDYLLTWMSEKQGMAPPHPEDRETILNYLAEHFTDSE